MTIYLLGWPGDLGGASTKLAHLLLLLRREFELVVVPLSDRELRDTRWQRQMDALGVRWSSFHSLPLRLRGWAVVMCHFPCVGSDLLAELRRRGLRIAWSNEMMWTMPDELAALAFGLFDAVLYVSPVQRAALEPQYRAVLSGAALDASLPDRDAPEGWLQPGRIRWVMNGNYIAPEQFEFRERGDDDEARRPLIVGRLSRPDPTKFPDDFPAHFEGLELQHPRFRVMGWSKELSARWPHHRFDERWELIEPFTERTEDFLQSLDLFVYALGPKFRESYGRVAVEAQLTGAVPLVPAGREHHLHNLVRHGETGFHCADQADYRRHAQRLESDSALRRKMSRRARAWAETQLCNAEEHLKYWRRLFYGGGAAPVRKRAKRSAN